MRITLDESECQIARFIGRNRNQINHSKGITDRRITPDDNSEQINVDGFAAELATAKLLNVYPDFTIANDGYYPPHDLTVNGKGVDVKQTRKAWGNAHMLATLKKANDPADIYFLMIGTIPHFDFAGWCFASDLIKDSTIKDFGHGPGYALHQYELNRDLSFFYPSGEAPSCVMQQQQRGFDLRL